MISWLTSFASSVLSIVAFEAAFLCWWRYFAISTGAAVRYQGPIPREINVKATDLLVGFALLFSVEGMMDVTIPLTRRIQDWLMHYDWLICIGMSAQVAIACWISRAMTREQCGEKIWLTMLATSVIFGLFMA